MNESSESCGGPPPVRPRRQALRAVYVTTSGEEERQGESERWEETKMASQRQKYAGSKRGVRCEDILVLGRIVLEDQAGVILFSSESVKQKV